MKNNISFNNVSRSLPEFDSHNSVLFIYNAKAKLRGYIAFHRGGFTRPSFGATRLLEYDTELDALKDALQLSRLMSYKNALAGLPYGGAKAVLMKPKKGTYKKSVLLAEYTRHVERLKGAFITGTDVGLTIDDLKIMFEKTKNLVGLTNNPEKATALGLYYSMESVAKFITGKRKIDGFSFAIQGAGKVGSEIIELIYKKASLIYVSEINKEKLKILKRKYPKIIIVDPKKIHQQKVDIFCPCALSNVLNSKSINQINAKAIVGSANNQLKSIEVGETLHRLGIIYCPDYVVNAGGLIAVADEYQNKKPGGKKLEEDLKGIGTRMDKILSLSKKIKKAPVLIANEMAEKIFAQQ